MRMSARNVHMNFNFRTILISILISLLQLGIQNRLDARENATPRTLDPCEGIPEPKADIFKLSAELSLQKKTEGASCKANDLEIVPAATVSPLLSFALSASLRATSNCLQKFIVSSDATPGDRELHLNALKYFNAEIKRKSSPVSKAWQNYWGSSAPKELNLDNIKCERVASVLAFSMGATFDDYLKIYGPNFFIQYFFGPAFYASLMKNPECENNPKKCLASEDPEAYKQYQKATKCLDQKDET